MRIKQKAIFFLLSLVFIQVVLQIFVFENGLRTSIRLVRSKELAHSELAEINAHNDELSQSIAALKSYPEMLEEQARFRLGLIGKHETFAMMMHAPSERH